MVNVSDSAAGKIKELLAEEQKIESGLRVFVQGGGCSGFQYGLMIEDAPAPGDQSIEANGIRLFVDPISARYLDGAEVGDHPGRARLRAVGRAVPGGPALARGRRVRVRVEREPRVLAG